MTHSVLQVLHSDERNVMEWVTPVYGVTEWVTPVFGVTEWVTPGLPRMFAVSKSQTASLPHV